MAVLIKRMSRREIRFIADSENDGPFSREEAEYLVGNQAPRYPVPSIYCCTEISNRVDERSNEIATFEYMLDGCFQDGRYDG